MLAGCWLGFSGVLFGLLVLVLGQPVLISLGASLALVAVLFWLWGRDIPAEDLQMRESLWNTPEDEDEDEDEDELVR